MLATVRKLNAVRETLRGCADCKGAGYVEWLSGSGCSVHGARCSCPVGRFDNVLAAHRVSRGHETRLAPAFRF